MELIKALANFRIQDVYSIVLLVRCRQCRTRRQLRSSWHRSHPPPWTPRQPRQPARGPCGALPPTLSSAQRSDASASAARSPTQSVPCSLPLAARQRLPPHRSPPLRPQSYTHAVRISFRKGKCILKRSVEKGGSLWLPGRAGREYRLMSHGIKLPRGMPPTLPTHWRGGLVSVGRLSCFRCLIYGVLTGAIRRTCQAGV